MFFRLALMLPGHTANPGRGCLKILSSLGNSSTCRTLLPRWTLASSGRQRRRKRSYRVVKMGILGRRMRPSRLTA